jgi:hypothetical protein
MIKMSQTKKNIFQFCLLLLSFNVVAQDGNKKSQAGGPATPNELIGFWKMVPLQNPKINKINPWPQSYQWFEFSKDGKISSMMSDENKEHSSNELHTIFKVFSKNRIPNYKVNGSFVTIDNPEIKNYLEIWGTNIFAKDIEGIAKKGDLMMTLDDGTQTGNVVYYRLLRRVK